MLDETQAIRAGGAEVPKGHRDAVAPLDQRALEVLMRRHVELRGDHIVQQGVADDLLARAAGGMGFPFAAAVGSHEEQPTRVRPISVVWRVLLLQASLTYPL